MINIFESIKNYLNNNKTNHSLKLQKEKSKTFFLKNDTLAGLDHESINELVNTLVSWYKIRIPDSIFMKNENDVVINKEDVAYKNYVNMTFEELFKRNVSLDLLKCNYRNGNPYAKGTLVLKIFTTTGLLKNKEDKVCRILADRSNGKIRGIEGDYLLPNNLTKNYTSYTLDEMAKLINDSHIDSLNYNSLSNCVKNRKKDILTRNKIIDTVCLELLNSNNNDFRYGYYRAFVFLKEINDYFDFDFDFDYLNRMTEKIKNKKNDNKTGKLKSKN